MVVPGTSCAPSGLHQGPAGARFASRAGDGCLRPSTAAWCLPPGRETVSDTFLFVLVFAGLVVLRIALATLCFALVLPRGDRCPNCDAVTLRLASRLYDRWLPWFRRS